MATREQIPLVLASTCLMTTQPILVKLSLNADGKMDYSSSASVFLSEAAKLLISASCYLLDPKQPKGTFRLRELLEYSVPGIIYFVNNNLQFLILEYVDAATFQLLSQLKSFFTALLFRAVLGRQLSFYQYLAIWQLACGSAVSQLAGTKTDEERSSSLIGFGLATFSCMLSALGGVYCEKLLKDKAKDSLHWQNMQLYMWGILFNGITMISSEYSTIAERGILHGFNAWAGAVVLSNTLTGLSIAAILKYADNIARVYAHACAMLLTMILSAVLFKTPITPQIVLAVCIVSSSVFQYNVKPEQLGFEPEKYERLPSVVQDTTSLADSSKAREPLTSAEKGDDAAEPLTAKS